MKLFRNILFVSEPSVTQGPALERAVTLAENNQADLTVLDVVPYVAAGLDVRPDAGADLQTTLVNERRKALESLVAPYRERLPVRTEVAVGRTFLEAIRAVLRDGHDLLVKPTENPAFLERLFGSNDMHLLRKCPCPVWLTRPDDKPDYTSIMAAVDFNLEAADEAEQDLNRQILEIAGSLALSDFAALHFTHAWEAPAETMVRAWSDNPNEAGFAYVEGERLRHERALNNLGEQLKEQIGNEAFEHLSPRFHLRRGEAAKVIPEAAEQLGIDLVVMGTVARSGIAGLLIGNTAETILEQLQCSVLAVKPSGFVSPIKPGAEWLGTEPDRSR